MQKIIFFSCLTIILLSISSCSVNKAKSDDSLQQIFEKYNSKGCFSFLNNATGEITVYNIGSDTTRYIPGTSFHIPLSLFALQNGTVPDENSVIQSTDSTQQMQCTSLTSAFQNNADSCFTLIAKKMKEAAFKKWMDSLHYGNTNTGKNFLQCWKDRSLKISPDEQLGLMKKLYFDQLPFRQSVQKSVRDMMKVEDNNLYTLSWKQSEPIKTTEGTYSSWVTGWIEENRHVYFFVTYAESTVQNKDNSASITKDILRKYEFFQGKK
jgi:beta-lactamase class D